MQYVTEEEIANCRRVILDYVSSDTIFTHGNITSVFDDGGKEYIDFTAQSWSLSFGYRNKQLIEAVMAQLETGIHHIRNRFLTIPRIKLVNALSVLAPVGLKKVSLNTQGGSISVEGAIKLSMINNPKEKIALPKTGYLGNTLALMGASHVGYGIRVKGFGTEKFVKFKYPYCYRCPEENTCGYSCIEDLINVLEKQDVSCVIFEPFMGNGGNIIPPKDYVETLREMCIEYNALLIFDESQTAFGRTGWLYASDYYKVYPDIMTLTKGLGSGFPIGAILAGNDIVGFESGEHHSTFSSNPMLLAVALKNLEMLDQYNMLSMVRESGKLFIDILNEMNDKIDIIGDVRGEGLFIGVEFIRDSMKSPLDVKPLVKECMKNGLLIAEEYVNGMANVISIKPPLIIQEEEIVKGLTILEESINNVY